TGNAAAQSGQAFANGIYLQGNNTLTFEPTGTQTISGVIGDDKGSALAANYTAPQNYTEGSVSVVVDGTGTLVLTGANTYTGTTTVEAGSLILAGNGSIALSSVTVDAAGTLGGAGVVGGATIAAGGTFAPANLLTFGLSLASGANFDEAIGGTTLGASAASGGYGRVFLRAGTINLGGATLDISLVNNFKPKVGNVFTILTNLNSEPITGTFDDPAHNALAQGATFSQDGVTYSIDYHADGENDVALTVVGVACYGRGTLIEAARGQKK